MYTGEAGYKGHPGYGGHSGYEGHPGYGSGEPVETFRILTPEGEFIVTPDDENIIYIPEP